MMTYLRFMLVFVVLNAGAKTSAQTEALDLAPEKQDEFRDIAEMLRCPTCQGLSVLESDAEFSKQIQQRVREQLDEGKTEREILAYFTERYGPWILREPPKEGINLIAWIFPVALLVLGPVTIWFFVWRRRKVNHTFSVRPTEAIIAEFEARVRAHKA